MRRHHRVDITVPEDVPCTIVVNGEEGQSYTVIVRHGIVSIWQGDPD